MKEINVTGQKRTDLGKKASKTLRKEGLVPCNLYGLAEQDGKPAAMAFAVPMTELRKIIYTPHIYVINLVIDGESRTAILKEIQFHPVTDAVLHIDFLEVFDNKPIVMEVPVVLDGFAEGVKAGGKLSLEMRKLKVKAVYTAIPEKLNINIDKLGLGKTMQVGALHFEGLELMNAKNAVVCAVKLTRAARGAAAKGN
jgi:large subunit ribosomal protein L25